MRVVALPQPLRRPPAPRLQRPFGALDALVKRKRGPLGKLVPDVAPTRRFRSTRPFRIRLPRVHRYRVDLTVLGRAGLHGWRKHFAERVVKRAPVADDAGRALFGTFFFVASLVYVIRSVRDLARELRG